MIKTSSINDPHRKKLSGKVNDQINDSKMNLYIQVETDKVEKVVLQSQEKNNKQYENYETNPKTEDRKNKVAPKSKPGVELPDSVLLILGDEYELEQIEGNGACAVNTLASHALGYATLGPVLGEALNANIAANW